MKRVCSTCVHKFPKRILYCYPFPFLTQHFLISLSLIFREREMSNFVQGQKNPCGTWINNCTDYTNQLYYVGKIVLLHLDSSCSFLLDSNKTRLHYLTWHFNESSGLAKMVLSTAWIISKIIFSHLPQN